MKSILRGTLLLAGISLIASAADAVPWGKPGLWEMSSTMQMSGMPQIPPAQLERMRKMGVKFPGMGGAPIVSKICVTPQDAAREFDARRYASEKGGCKQASMAHNGKHFTSTVVCNGEMKGQGNADVTLIDDSHYSTVFAFKGTSHGRAMDMKVSSTAHWLGAACGSVKPFQIPHRG